MLGLNELFLPLLGGYILVTQWFVTRYLARQWSGYRLFFNSAIAGIVLLAVAIFLAQSIKLAFPPIQQLLDASPLSSYPYLNVSLLAFLLGSVCGRILNVFQTDKESLAIDYARKFGGPLQVLLAKAFIETKQVSITLRSGKVYIGFVTKLNDSQDQEEFILIWPQFSGYRKVETKQLEITTEYTSVYKQIEENPEQFEGISIDDFQVVLPTSEIESVSIYDKRVFDSFLNKGDIS
ncbi:MULTISPECIES: hypothetical protein [unclassified Leptolyngbya]|uniref:hypothetical protein n=1 Tax=unclassified Leptolyngbya TaxID=2650499 RepID=UPI001688F1A6|nr:MULTISPECIES: hypothetical protein [unclassified Leptolyngbya]MBD1913613.1 hypothetical protein [Leptolyngbya sp. FACHB-8]MBD2154056.1 hypothetical protein [Leptolyngbya sp. FACHB-16]